MKTCNFCGVAELHKGTKVKLISITYNGTPSIVCVTCQSLDGIEGDK